jgi:pimeloyl-ACP methyl ester carboxylesterase
MLNPTFHVSRGGTAMAYCARPDGARIYYEVRGTGFPLLLIAPGGVNSQISFWSRTTVDALTFADEFMVIAMDQRNAEHSPAPLAAPTWDDHAGDLLAVLDAVGAQRTHVWGGCIGVAYVLRLLHDAPDRVQAAVCQNPVGFAEGVNDRATFFAMFQPTIETAQAGGTAAVVAAALENPFFVENNRAGPFAARIAADPQFRAEVLALDPAAYERIIRAYDQNIWGRYAPYVSVEASFVRQIPQPLLVLPGSDPFHPTPVAERLAAEAPNVRYLDLGWRAPERAQDTAAQVRAFLREHSPQT